MDAVKSAIIHPSYAANSVAASRRETTREKPYSSIGKPRRRPSVVWQEVGSVLAESRPQHVQFHAPVDEARQEQSGQFIDIGRELACDRMPARMASPVFGGLDQRRDKFTGGPAAFQLPQRLAAHRVFHRHLETGATAKDGRTRSL